MRSVRFIPSGALVALTCVVSCSLLPPSMRGMFVATSAPAPVVTTQAPPPSGQVAVMQPTTEPGAATATTSTAAPASGFGNFSASSTTTTTTTTTTSSSSSSTSGGGGATPNGCKGDFSLGSLPLMCRSCSLGTACDNPDAPRNCIDGTYIRFDDGRCMCIARCSSFGIEEGASCGDGFTCRHIQSVTSGNHATVCVADAWNVCLHGQVAAPETHRRRGLRD